MLGRRHAQPAFTLIECLMASALLAFVVAAVCQAIVAGQMQTADALHDLRGMAIAEMTMEEILALPYADPEGAAAAGPDSGETTRAAYDNCDDYHGFAQTAGNVTDGTGAVLPSDYDRFAVSVTAAYGTKTVAGLATSMPGLDVTVTVTDTTGREWELQRFIPEPN